MPGGSLCTVLQNLYSIRNLHSTIAVRITPQIVRLALQHRHRQILQGTGQQFPILVAGIRLCGIKRNLILPGRCALWDHHCQNRKGQCLIVYDFICPVVGGIPQESGRLGRCYPALILFPCPAAAIAVWLRKGQPPDLQRRIRQKRCIDPGSARILCNLHGNSQGDILAGKLCRIKHLLLRMQAIGQSGYRLRLHTIQTGQHGSTQQQTDALSAHTLPLHSEKSASSRSNRDMGSPTTL